MSYLDIQLDRDEMHTKLGGALPKNSLVLIEGNDGGGKSVLCQRLMYSMLKNDHTATYISTELNTHEFVSQMKSLNYHITKDLLDENLLFVPMFPFYGNVKLNKSFMDDLISESKLYDNEIIIFDTFSYLLVKNHSDCDFFDIMSFFKQLLGLGKTLLVAIEPSQMPEDFLNMIHGMSDVFLKVEVRDYLGKLTNFIDIIRYKRAKKRLQKRIPFRVDPGIGMAIEISS